MSVYFLNFPIVSSSITAVTASTANRTVLNQNSNRSKFIMMHTGSARAYVLLSGSGTPSSASCTFFMDNGDYIEEPDYKGAVIITFLSNSATTYVYTTDFFQ